MAGLFLDVVSGGWSCFWFLGGTLAFTMFCGGALLGFEGSVAVWWLRFLCGSPGSSGFCREGFWGVCFENFIVDASIFVVFVVGFFGKLLSAIGDCGTKKVLPLTSYNPKVI